MTVWPWKFLETNFFYGFLRRWSRFSKVLQLFSRKTIKKAHATKSKLLFEARQLLVWSSFIFFKICSTEWVKCSGSNISKPPSGIGRSSRPEVFCRKGVLRNFAKFRRKHLCQSLFLNKVPGWGLQTLA